MQNTFLVGGRRVAALTMTLVLLCASWLVVAAEPAFAATVVVNQNHEQGWHMEHTVCPSGSGANSGDQRFVPGPEGAPGAPGKNPVPDDAPDVDDVDSDSPNGGPPGPSSGSLEIEIGENGWTVEQFRNSNYHGVAVEDITTLRYWTYQRPPEEGPEGPDNLGYEPGIYIRLNIDTGGSEDADDVLVYEPVYQVGDGQHELDWGAWQEWIADDADGASPEGLWWLESEGDDDFRTLDQWLATDDSEWTIVNEDDRGGVILGAGCGHEGPWTDFVGNTDHFTIEVEGRDNTTYDFEPGVPTEQATLDCEPETDENPTSTNHTITCTAATASAGDDHVPARGREIHVEATGANDPDKTDSKESPDFTCTTGNDGTCTIVHGPSGPNPEPTSEPGTTLYTAWVDNDAQTVEADRREARDESETGAGDDAESDGTDVVEKTWIARSAQGGGVDAEPEADANELGVDHTITATVYDQAGTPLQGATTVNFEFFDDSPSDSDGNTPATPDRTCRTNNTTSCTLMYSESNQLGTDRICVFTNSAPAMSGSGAAATCDGERGSDADDASGTADPPTPVADDQDVVTHTWTAPTVRELQCLPEAETAPTGSAHQISCTVTSTGGSGMSGVQVDVEIRGANDPDAADSPTTPDLTCTTGPEGTCSVRHGAGGSGTSSAGITTYRAWVDVDQSNSTVEADQAEPREEGSGTGSGEPDRTDVVSVTWQASPLECEPETSSGPLGISHDLRCTVAAGTNVDVEITGANDPDDSDSPATPDLTCSAGSDRGCSVAHAAPPSANGGKVGSTLYRVWIDADGSNATTEADATEGRDERTTPGAVVETDGTEVLERTWTDEAVTACNDGADNDSDGYVDHPDDPGCGSASDGDETDPAETRVTCPGFESDPRNQIVGSGGEETLEGSRGDDIICGRGGADVLIGRGGNDLIVGGRGKDYIRGGRGADDLRGGAGSDRIKGGPDRDSIDGGRGRDRCSRGPGGATLRRCE